MNEENKSEENQKKINKLVKKLDEIEDSIFSKMWYKDKYDRQASFLIGVLMNKVSYRSKKKFDTIQTVKRLHSILKNSVKKKKLIDIFSMCEEELIKIESSIKRTEQGVFGKKLYSPLIERINGLIRNLEEDFTSKETLISFFDGYYHFMGNKKQEKTKSEEDE